MEDLSVIKETLIFLVEQEKLRGEEVKALNEKIEAVNNFMMDNIVNPALEADKAERFEDFKGKYGERLSKYNDVMRASGNADYDGTTEAFNELEGLSDEEKKDINIDEFVDKCEGGLCQYVDEIKKSLGIEPDVAVEIKADENGEVEVKADENGDGEPEAEVTEKVESAEKEEEEKPTEEPAAEEPEEEDLQKEYDEYLKNHPNMKSWH